MQANMAEEVQAGLCLALSQPSTCFFCSLSHLSRKQHGSLPIQILPSDISWLQQGHIHSELLSARYQSTSFYFCHLLICISGISQ